MNNIREAMLCRKRPDPAGQVSLQGAETLAAAFKQNSDKIDHGIGWRNNHLQIIITQRVASDHRYLAHNAHRFQELCALCVTAQHDNPRPFARQHFYHGPANKTGTANHCYRFVHTRPQQVASVPQILPLITGNRLLSSSTECDAVANNAGKGLYRAFECNGFS
jgi:hypothetical protein